MRRRELSDDERVLWESVAKQAKPLRKKKRVKTVVAVPTPVEGQGRTKVAKPGTGEGEQRVAPRPSMLAAGVIKTSPSRGESTTTKAPPARTTLERREKSRLARGIREIDARIDLHGMTQARAHRALLSFMKRAQDDGCRYVLVITGKGKTLSGAERGVLRRQVPEWLALAEFRVLVTGYEEAAIGHGGAGALYVRVRRG